MITVRFVAQVEYVKQVDDDVAAIEVWDVRGVAREFAACMEDLERVGFRPVCRIIESGHVYGVSAERVADLAAERAGVAP